MDTLYRSGFIGDQIVLTLPLKNKDGTAFTPGDDYVLILTAKYKDTDLDPDAVFQLTTGAGIVHSTSNAVCTVHRDSTVDLDTHNLIFDVQAQHVVTGEIIKTVAYGRLQLQRDITRETTTSVPVITTETPLPFGPLIPTQTGNSGKYLTTDGTDTSWDELGSAAQLNVGANSGNIPQREANGSIECSEPSAKMTTSGAAGLIGTSGNNSHIYTSGETSHIKTIDASSYIQTASTFRLWDGANDTILEAAAGGARTLTFPAATGTIALELTSGPVTSSAGVSAIADGAIALSKLAADPLARANHTGTQDVSTITGLGTAATADYLGPLHYFPVAQKSSTMMSIEDGSMYVYAGESWHPCVASAEIAAKYNSYVAAVESSGFAPSSGWSEFKSRYFAFLSELQKAGILVNLVDGAYYAADGMVSSGLPLSFSAVSPTQTGTFERITNGIRFDKSATQRLEYAITPMQTGTMIGDYSFEASTENDTMVPLELRNSARTTYLFLASISGGRFVQFTQAGASGSIGENESGSRTAFSHSLLRTTGSLTFTDGALTSYLYGCYSPPDSAAPAFVLNDMDRIHVVGGSANSFKGVMHNWLLFDKILDLAENKAVTRALAILDSRPINLLVEGDSTSALDWGYGRARDCWPAKILSVSGWDSTARLGIAAARSGEVTTAFASHYDLQIKHNIAKGKRNVLVAWGGINDIGSGASAATVYGRLKSYAETARAAGIDVLIPTIAIPSVTSYPGVHASLNVLIRAGHVAGDFDVLVDVDAAIPNHDGANAALWLDSSHLNGAGNAIVADLIAAAVRDFYGL